ncbi:hypothetical protein PVW53_21470 [Seohaeicola sp. SP36]|uniref:hypothetical protein n=1 Tax=unclassified Seohaeicola TaxID=2641111 RepID=UPI00237C2803|nr:MULTISPECIES: hypothetical protein [unclassified Seohaeicola]MDD9709817.1 hypothetical protein [Seohaeicola sp. 4SK31]MDD9738070.1 hypothetical protein [Seohaeicola sp. SP36]
MKIIAGERARSPDAALLRALRNAHRWSAPLRSGTSLKAIADMHGYSESYVARKRRHIADHGASLPDKRPRKPLKSHGKLTRIPYREMRLGLVAERRAFEPPRNFLAPKKFPK